MSDRQPRFSTHTFYAAELPSRLGIASIEAWPAAGGGLLVGIAEPGLAGAAPLRAAVKTMFLRLDSGSAIHLIFPYVVLDPEPLFCARALIAAELFIPETSVVIARAPADERFPMPDLHPAVELGLKALAATVRTLLVVAAAENWNRPQGACETIDGMVRSADRVAPYADFSADAALSPIPDRLRLRCGREISIS